MPDHENLAAALAAFQAELPKIIKDETARVPGKDGKQGYIYGYADLAQVTEAVSPVLGKHGLAFTAKPTMTANGFGLVYKLMHGASGEVDEGFWPIHLAAMQTMGSAITYARRYALLAATNTFPDKEDDDGAAASQSHRNRGAEGATRDEDWDRAVPAKPSRSDLLAAGQSAIAGAADVETLARLKDRVDGYALDNVITLDDAQGLHAAILAREAELSGNQVDAVPASTDGSAPKPSGPPIRDEQRRKMFGLFNDLAMGDRTRQMELMRRVAGRDLESRNDLTAEEATNIIAVLEGQKHQGGKTNGHHPEPAGAAV